MPTIEMIYFRSDDCSSLALASDGEFERQNSFMAGINFEKSFSFKASRSRICDGINPDRNSKDTSGLGFGFQEISLKSGGILRPWLDCASQSGR
jgi:hypothetical protein